ETCTTDYKGYTLSFKLDILNYEEGKEVWKNRTLLINKTLLNDFEREVFAALIGMDDNHVKLVNKSSIDSAKVDPNNTNIMVWTYTVDEFGLLNNNLITDAGGSPMMWLSTDTFKKLCLVKRPAEGARGTEEFGTKIAGTNVDFKLDVIDYSGSKTSPYKTKTIYVSSTLCNDYSRMALAGLLDMKDETVKLVPDAELRNILSKGDNDGILLLDTIDIAGDYAITTVNGVELLSLNKAEFDVIRHGPACKPALSTQKCVLLCNNKEYIYNFPVEYFGPTVKTELANKTLYVDSAHIDELARKILSAVFGIDDS